jgi:hypothetical protein
MSRWLTAIPQGLAPIRSTSTSVPKTWTRRTVGHEQADVETLARSKSNLGLERSFYARYPFENPICFVDSQTLFTGSRDWQ